MANKEYDHHALVPVEFHAADIITAVPTCCLIEDYWILHNAMKNLDRLKALIPESNAVQGIWGDIKDDIGTAMDCIQESIDRFTMVQKDLQIRPSVYSAIAMCCESGIILDNKRKDLLCAAGHPVSEAGERHCATCPFADHHGGSCDPDGGFLVLANDIRYLTNGNNAEAFVDSLYDRYEPVEE